MGLATKRILALMLNKRQAKLLDHSESESGANTFMVREDVISKRILDGWGTQATLLTSFSSPSFLALPNMSRMTGVMIGTFHAYWYFWGGGKGLLVIYHPPIDPIGMYYIIVLLNRLG